MICLVRRDLREGQRLRRAAPAGRDAARAGRCGRRRAASPPTRRRRPAPTESNGLTPASSRWTSRPLMLTIRSRLRGSNFCSTRGSRADSLRRAAGGRAASRTAAGSGPRAPRVGRRGAARLRPPQARSRSNARRARTSASPRCRRSHAARAATTACAARTGRPARRTARAASPRARRAGRPRPRPAARCPCGARTSSKISTCCGRPVASRSKSAELLLERGQHRRRVADQEGVRHRREPLAAHVRQQVMRHLLLVEDPDVRRQRREQRLDHAPPVGLVLRDDLVAARVVEARDLEVVGVEGLVHDPTCRCGSPTSA